MQLDPKGLEQAIAAAFCTRENGNIDFDAAIATAIRAYLLAAPSPSPSPGVEQIAETHLSNLLARIHRDGGHYEAEHGTDKACEDADRIIAELYAATPANPSQVTDALRIAHSFIAREYRDEKSIAMEGEFVSREARPVFRALSDALAALTPIGAGGQAVAGLPEGTLSVHGKDVVIAYDDFKDARRAFYLLEAAIAHPVQPGWRESLLDKLAEHKNFELSWGAHPDDDTEACWQVHRVNGGRNDREWTLIGVGNTPHEALYAALPAAPQPKGE